MYIGTHVFIVLVFIVIGGALINQLRNIPVVYRFLIIVILLNLLLTAISPTWSLFNYFALDHMTSENSSDFWAIRGQIGDVLAGHATVLAFVALLVTISQMKESLEKQDKAIDIQQEYIRKQEFENHFFKLYDEFKIESIKVTESKIFVQCNKQIHDENITDIANFKESIYVKSDYPIAYFKLLKFLLIYISDNKEDEKYVFLIKNKLSNLDLTYIALHDIVIDDKEFSKILEKLNIYEYYDANDDEVFSPMIMLLNYKLLTNKLSEWTTNNDI